MDVISFFDHNNQYFRHVLILGSYSYCVYNKICIYSISIFFFIGVLLRSLVVRFDIDE